MIDELKIEDEHIIDDPETLKVLGDPLRIQILGQVAQLNESGQLATAKALAEALDVTQTKLYYHLNLLENHDLLRVAETGLVSGIVEKRYQIRARRLRADVNIEPSQDLDREQEMETVLAPLTSIIDNTLHNLKQSIEAAFARQDPDESADWEQIHIQQKTLRMTDEQALRFTQQLEDLIKEYKQLRGEQGRLYHLTSIFHPGKF